MDIWIWMGGNPFLGAFEWVGPEISTFLGPNGTRYSRCRSLGMKTSWTLPLRSSSIGNYPPICARIYRPSFHENKPKTLVFSHTKRAFWACFRENWVYNFGHLFQNMLIPSLGTNWAFWAVFHENAYFHAQIRVYKFGLCSRKSLIKLPLTIYVPVPYIVLHL
jgi:hypothetical protein